jgi:hypothetical protein
MQERRPEPSRLFSYSAAALLDAAWVDQEIFPGLSVDEQLIEPLRRGSAAGPLLALGSAVFRGQRHGQFFSFGRTRRLGHRLPWLLRIGRRTAQLFGGDVIGGHLFAQFGQDSGPVLFLQFGGLLLHVGNLLAERDEFIHGASFEIRALQGGEMMLLRAIQKIVIRDMLERIE